VWITTSTPNHKEALVSHRNATLTPTGRLRLARCVVEDGWPLRRAAERFQVSVPCAQRWAARYRAHGAAGMNDRSSRPRRSPRRLPPRRERRILALRVTRRWGPARIAAHLRMAASTVHGVLRRYRVPHLADLDRVTGRAVRRRARRYERDHPGELVHVDIKKLGNIPDGGGHKMLGRVAGRRDRRRGVGYAYLHNAVDDHSRLAYTEILPDERKQTAAQFWRRAAAWFAAHGIERIERVLTDNGSCYRSRDFAAALDATDTVHKRTRPYRPQTNGKVERYNRTLLDEWAYAALYTSEADRRAALPGWLHTYNHHRSHTALGGPPASRVTNLSGQNN
jgi:transposase InsO family protein